MVVCPCSRPRNPNANPTSFSLSLSLSLAKAPTKILPAALQAMASVRGRVSSSAMPQTSFSTAFSWLRSSMLLRSRIAICCTAARDIMAGPSRVSISVPRASQSPRRSPAPKRKLFLTLGGTAEVVPFPKKISDQELFSSLRRGKPRLHTSFSRSLLKGTHRVQHRLHPCQHQSESRRSVCDKADLTSSAAGIAPDHAVYVK